MERALPYVQLIDARMTPAFCGAFCAARGFQFSGTQYASECYCGRIHPRMASDVAQEIDKSNCAMKCIGDTTQSCGGAFAVSLLPVQPLPTDDRRPLVCLAIMLKNEAHTINNTLRSVRDAIDCWVVLDTGSTDGTQAIVREWLRHKPGVLVEEAFVDYGHTRNRVLDLVNQSAAGIGMRPVFALTMSADETLLNAAEMRTFLADHRHALGAAHGAYPVLMNSGIDFDSMRITRVDANWRYRGRVHEYIASPTGDGSSDNLVRPRPEIRIKFVPTDGDRRHKSQYYIISVLEDEVRINPLDTRSWLYLGSTYAGVNNLTGALRAYEQLGRVSKWNDEAYHARLNAAELMVTLKHPWADVQARLLELHEFLPTRADALYTVADHHFNAGNFRLAYMFAAQCAQIKAPANLQAVQSVLLRDTKSLYDWKVQRLLGFAANRAGHDDVCVATLTDLVKRYPNDRIAIQWMGECRRRLPVVMVPVAGVNSSVQHAVSHARTPAPGSPWLVRVLQWVHTLGMLAALVIASVLSWRLAPVRLHKCVQDASKRVCRSSRRVPV